MRQRLRLFGIAVLVVTTLTGCGAAAVQTAATTEQAAARGVELDDPHRLPDVLEELDLSAPQRQELLALRDRLEPKFEPLSEAMRDLALAIAAAATRCDAKSMVVDDATSWAVLMGQQTRPAMLDGIDELHRILTKSQRKALVRRLKGEDKEAKDRDSESDNDSGARSLGETLDLSFGQMLTLLGRARALRDAAEQRLRRLKPKYENALAGFVSNDFAIRDYEVAEAPVFVMGGGLVRDAVRSLLPILELEQCKALGKFIREGVRKTEKHRKKR